MKEIGNYVVMSKKEYNHRQRVFYENQEFKKYGLDKLYEIEYFVNRIMVELYNDNYDPENIRLYAQRIESDLAEGTHYLDTISKTGKAIHEDYKDLVKPKE